MGGACSGHGPRGRLRSPLLGLPWSSGSGLAKFSREPLWEKPQSLLAGFSGRNSGLDYMRFTLRSFCVPGSPMAAAQMARQLPDALRTGLPPPCTLLHPSTPPPLRALHPPPPPPLHPCTSAPSCTIRATTPAGRRPAAEVSCPRHLACVASRDCHDKVPQRRLIFGNQESRIMAALPPGGSFLPCPVPWGCCYSRHFFTCRRTPAVSAPCSHRVPSVPGSALLVTGVGPTPMPTASA